MIAELLAQAKAVREAARFAPDREVSMALDIAVDALTRAEAAYRVRKPVYESTVEKLVPATAVRAHDYMTAKAQLAPELQQLERRK